MIGYPMANIQTIGCTMDCKDVVLQLQSHVLSSQEPFPPCRSLAAEGLGKYGPWAEETGSTIATLNLGKMALTDPDRLLRVEGTKALGKFFVLPWGLDQSFRSSNIQSAGYCSDSMLQSCLQNTGCAKDYQTVFLQTAKALGAQETALLALANLAAKQTGEDVRSNIRAIITALGKYA